MPRPPTRPAGTVEQVFSTNEGPVVITTRGRLVFVAESFDLDQASQAGQPDTGCAGDRRS